MKNYHLDLTDAELKRQINLLPEINREVAEKYYLEKKTIKEIAFEFAISVTVVKSRLAMALYLIRKNTGYEPYQEAYKIFYGN